MCLVVNKSMKGGYKLEIINTLNSHNLKKKKKMATLHDACYSNKPNGSRNFFF
jgi:hypothetical protein